MANISDIIEQFILNTLGEDKNIDISRNELASFFSCAPSQINYVLETRFTPDKGFLKESRRGGGGYIKLTRIPIEEDSYVNNLVLESIGEALTFKRASHILEKLVYEKILTEREAGIVKAAISDDSLAMPFAIKDKVRAKAFKNMLLYLLKEKD